MLDTRARSSAAVRSRSVPIVPQPFRRDVARRLDALATRSPERAAFIDARGGESLGWGDLARAARQVARELAPNSLVAVVAASPTAFVRIYLAGLAAGVCVAPLDPRTTPDGLGHLLDVLGAGDVVVEAGSEHAEELSGSGLRVWASSQRRFELIAGTRGGPAARMPDGIAEVLATSGTSGAPKLVPLSERQLLHVAGAIVAHHQLGEDDRGYCPLPLFHINAQVVGVLSTLVAGSSLVLDRRFHRTETWGPVEELTATWLNLVPAILSTLCSEQPPPESLARRIRFARSASAALPVPVLERFEAHTRIGVLETYGLTEAASQVTANPLDRRERRPGSAGRPVAAELRIVDEGGQAVAPGELGAVEIAGAGVIEAYLGSGGELIPARGPAGWFRTGDVGRLDGDGFIHLAGRSDDVINRGGELVEPREVEDLIRFSPGVCDAAVVGRPDAVLGAVPVAFVRPLDGLEEPARRRLVAELERAFARVLSPYKRPVEIRLVDALPVGATGKVSRRNLAERLEQEVLAVA